MSERVSNEHAKRLSESSTATTYEHDLSLDLLDARQRIKELDADYRRVIREVLACDPRPAKDRADDQLEPPWEVIARIRRDRDDLLELLFRFTPDALDEWLSSHGERMPFREEGGEDERS